MPEVPDPNVYKNYTIPNAHELAILCIDRSGSMDEKARVTPGDYATSGAERSPHVAQKDVSKHQDLMDHIFHNDKSLMDTMYKSENALRWYLSVIAFASNAEVAYGPRKLVRTDNKSLEFIPKSSLSSLKPRSEVTNIAAGLELAKKVAKEWLDQRFNYRQATNDQKLEPLVTIILVTDGMQSPAAALGLSSDPDLRKLAAEVKNIYGDKPFVHQGASRPRVRLATAGYGALDIKQVEKVIKEMDEKGTPLDLKTKQSMYDGAVDMRLLQSLATDPGDSRKPNSGEDLRNFLLHTLKA